MKKALIIFMSLICIQVYAQQTTESTQSASSIEGRFEQIMKEGGRYKDYKVIKQVELLKLKNETTARIGQLKDSIKTLEEQITEKDQNINQLKAEITSKDQNIKDISNDKDSISFLGLTMSKIFYNILLWSIIGLLILALLTFIYKYRNSNEITKASIGNLKLVEEELESYKRRSIEKEQQLSRQLMDERKKNSNS